MPIYKIYVRILFVFVSTISLITLASCSFNKRDNLSRISSKPLVLTSFTVLADMSRNVAGNRIDVISITKQGVEIHGYKPTPKDLILVSKADLIIENGLGLEAWAEKFTKSEVKAPTVVLSKGIKPLLIGEDVYKGKPNPHAWMSPLQSIHYVEKIVEAFIAIDPEGKSYFINNGEIYKNKLRKLDNELRAALSQIPSKNKLLVTCEGAFSYLANDYGMKEAYLWPVNSDGQVTPRRMLSLIEKIKESEVPTIFCESTVSAKHQLEVARTSGATFGGTFYVDSLSSADGPASTFIDLQRHNVRLILNGLLPDKKQN